MKSLRRVEKFSGNHGLDQLEDLRWVTERQRAARRLIGVSVTYLSGSAGEGSIAMAWRWGRVFSISRRFQFGVGRERGVLR